MSKRTRWIGFRKVPDGIVCEGLVPGRYEIARELWDKIKEMSDDGRFYPYKFDSLHYSNELDTYLVDVTEE